MNNFSMIRGGDDVVFRGGRMVFATNFVGNIVGDVMVVFLRVPGMVRGGMWVVVRSIVKTLQVTPAWFVHKTRCALAYTVEMHLKAHHAFVFGRLDTEQEFLNLLAKGKLNWSAIRHAAWDKERMLERDERWRICWEEYKKKNIVNAEILPVDKDEQGNYKYSDALTVSSVRSFRFSTVFGHLRTMCCLLEPGIREVKLLNATTREKCYKEPSLPAVVEAISDEPCGDVSGKDFEFQCDKSKKPFGGFNFDFESNSEQQTLLLFYLEKQFACQGILYNGLILMPNHCLEQASFLHIPYLMVNYEGELMTYSLESFFHPWFSTQLDLVISVFQKPMRKNLILLAPIGAKKTVVRWDHFVDDEMQNRPEPTGIWPVFRGEEPDFFLYKGFACAGSSGAGVFCPKSGKCVGMHLGGNKTLGWSKALTFSKTLVRYLDDFHWNCSTSVYTTFATVSSAHYKIGIDANNFLVLEGKCWMCDGNCDGLCLEERRLPVAPNKKFHAFMEWDARHGGPVHTDGYEKIDVLAKK